jgi:S-adenosylmethionine hydrolase
MLLMVLHQPIITLTSDFGTADGYVGAMKGVLLTICPQARLVDITHTIPAQDVRHAALTLWNAVRTFPPDTVHLVVVDPGVGSARRPLALRSAAMTYVAPDNGVLTLVARDVEWAVVLDNPEFYWHGAGVSQTFHGRDIFSPAAAHLAAGRSWSELGSPTSSWQSLSFPRIEMRSSREWTGEVLYLDHFGNAITNLGLLEWREGDLRFDPLFAADRSPRRLSLPATLVIQGRRLKLCRTYSDVAPGEPLALVGSSGLLEAAVRDGSAGRDLTIQPGDPVILRAELVH